MSTNIVTLPDERAGRLCEEILGMVLQVQPAMTLVSALGVLEVVKHQLIKMGEQ